jgi:DNA-binding MarR family transcriptional regulator
MISKIEIPIGGLLGRTSHKLSLLLDKVFHKNEIDINVEQFMLLKTLSFNDGVNQQKLSEIIGRDKTTIARLVSRIEKKNMILRVHSKEDKRVNNIYLTNLGKEILSKVEPYLLEINNSLAESISTEELDMLKEVLTKLNSQIEEMKTKL